MKYVRWALYVGVAIVTIIFALVVLDRLRPPMPPLKYTAGDYRSGAPSDVSVLRPPPYAAADLGADLGRPRSYKVPELPPGRYELNTAVVALYAGGGKSEYSVFFVVARPCDDHR